MREFQAEDGGGAIRDLLFSSGRGGQATPAGITGVVVEVEIENGLVDSVAGYADGTARYLNHSGMAIVWEAPDDAEVAGRVSDLLASAASIPAIAGPIDTPVPGRPGQGQALVAALTDRGILVGMGPYGALAADATAGPVMKAAFDLMTTLMARAEAQGRA